MRYCVSDIHGEYDLFLRLLQKIRFSDADEMLICGDIIDKGPDSVRLAKLIFSFPNMRCIMGNHEHTFVRLYHTLMQSSPEDFDAVWRICRHIFRTTGICSIGKRWTALTSCLIT